MSAVDGAHVPDLAQHGRVAVITWTLHPLNGVDILAGGLTDEAKPAHLRLVDIPKATAYLAPLTARQLEGIVSQAMALQR